jgi:hypothetical protein
MTPVSPLDVLSPSQVTAVQPRRPNRVTLSSALASARAGVSAVRGNRAFGGTGEKYVFLPLTVMGRL